MKTYVVSDVDDRTTVTVELDDDNPHACIIDDRVRCPACEMKALMKDSSGIRELMLIWAGLESASEDDQDRFIAAIQHSSIPDACAAIGNSIIG